jgi:hypothetical protein
MFSEELDDFSDSPDEPNQGIKESCRNFVMLTFMTLAVVTTLIIIGKITLKEFMWSQDNLFLIKMIFFMTLAGALVTGLPFGGYAVIQHLCLRIVFTRHYGIPWNLAQFLTYCHERRILQQIGGRYRFIHRELLDHFANQPTR